MVTTAVAKVDLMRKIEIQLEDAMGAMNSTGDSLSAFASEITHLTFEVGTLDILGGQARLKRPEIIS
jgi:hypothetical protein